MRSYLTYLQNWYGPPAVAGVANIANTTREDFIFFIHQHADRDLENDPVLPDNDLMLRSQQLRAGVYTSNSNNARSRSSSRGSSRSRSPPTRRVINHALQQFSKEKRPLTDYNMPLKEIKEWPEFDRQLCAVAHTHGVDDVLDHRYSPVPGSDDEEVFEKKQGHMYSVFVRLVKETKGLGIVKGHKDDKDAQTIYKKMSDYYTGEASQIAIANLDEMEDSIIDGTIPLTRRQSLLLYMEKWKAKLDDFNSLAPPDRYMNEAQTLSHLKRFIRHVPELQDMNKLVDIMCTGLRQDGRAPTSKDKIQMYFNVATKVDKDARAANRGRRGVPSRNIHLTEILGEDTEEDDDDVQPLENNAHEVLPDVDMKRWMWRCTELLPPS